MTDDFTPALIDDDTNDTDGEPTGPDAIPDVREDEVTDPEAETAPGSEPTDG